MELKFVFLDGTFSLMGLCLGNVFHNATQYCFDTNFHHLFLSFRRAD